MIRTSSILNIQVDGNGLCHVDPLPSFQQTNKDSESSPATAHEPPDIPRTLAQQANARYMAKLPPAFRNPLSRDLPPRGPPAARPSPILRRLSSTSQRRAEGAGGAGACCGRRHGGARGRSRGGGAKVRLNFRMVSAFNRMALPATCSPTASGGDDRGLQEQKPDPKLIFC
jgi:hypothetical protein